MDRSLGSGVLGLAVGLGCGLAIQVGIARQLASTPPGSSAPSTQTPSPAGGGRGMAFTEPTPLDFNDHEGYVSLFDGVSLKGWDGNSKFWRVEEGAIVGESTP